MARPTHTATVEELKQIFEARMGVITDLVIAIDGSGSVNDYQFDIMRSAVRSILSFLPFNDTLVDNPPIRVGVLQFCDQTYLVCGLERTASAVATAVTGMIQRKQGTDAKIALREAMALIKRSERPSASKMIILFTDGDVSDAHDEAERLKSTERAFILVLAIGVPFSHKVSSLGSRALYIASFHDMQAIFDELSVSVAGPPTVILRARGTENASFEVIYQGEFKKFEVQLFEENSNQWITRGTSEGRTCFVQDLKPNTVYTVGARAQLKNGGYTKWSNEVNVKQVQFKTLYANPDALVLKNTRELPQVVSALVAKLNTWKPPFFLRALGIKAYNISLMGRAGNGKSCYLNTANSSLKGIWQPLNVTRGGGDTVTLRLSKFALNGARTINLWDIYGWTATNYSAELDLILDGNLPDGYKEGAQLAKYFNGKPLPSDKAHAVIIVCEGPAVQTREEMDRLKHFFRAITSKGLYLIVILTKMDLLPDANLAKVGYQNIYDIGVIDQAIETFCYNTDIDRSCVYPVVNYTGPAQRNMVIEKLCLDVLHKAVLQANATLKGMYRHYIQIVDVATAKPFAVLEFKPDSTLADVREAVKARQTAKKFPSGDFRFIPDPDDDEVLQTCDEVDTPAQNAVVDHEGWPTLKIKFMSGGTPSTIGPPACSDTPGSSSRASNEEPPSSLKASVVGLNGQRFGFLPDLQSDSKLAEVRKRIQEELDESDLQNFHFLKPDRQPVTPVEEGSAQVKTILCLEDDRWTIVVGFEVTIERLTLFSMSQDGKEQRYGQLRQGVKPSMTLAALRNQIEEELELELHYRFLTAAGDPVGPRQEQNVTASECVRTTMAGTTVCHALQLQKRDK